MVMTPIELFKVWYSEEQKIGHTGVLSPCCLSTIGTDGFPNARFVSLKEIQNDCFIVTGTMSSRKGTEIEKNNKVALTFWWDATRKHIRVQGTATRINDDDADRFFYRRDRDSQIVSVVSRQGAELHDLEKLEMKYHEFERSYQDTLIQRPVDFGGYAISPVRIELMEFKETRFHIRTVYELNNGTWNHKYLQP
jgi:pyridoxamine 5'-phosphate oxidase